MRIHANARTCPNSRRLLVRRIEEEGWALTPAAEAAGVSVRTARKWLARWRAEGEAGLVDRSSAPRRRPTRLPADRLEAIEALRRLRMTAAEIAEVLGMALSTVSRWLRRIGLGRRERPGTARAAQPLRAKAARGADPRRRQEARADRRQGCRAPGHRQPSRPAEGRREGQQRRATGWEFVHVCVDDATRLAYVEVLPDEKGATAAGFLRRAVAWLAWMGVTVERVLSDNGACYRSRAHAEVCRELGIRHLFTRPYRPRTNGKAERFIQTMTNSWAYGAIYGSSAERTAALPGWLDHYNFRRRHGSLGHRPPAARLAELEQPRE